MPFRPKENRILSALKKKGYALGMFSNTASPMLIELLAYNEFDFYILDFEHSLVDLKDMAVCVRTADAAGITSCVRVPKGNAEIITHAIETGVQGIMASHINNVEDVRKLIDDTRYPPEGKGGICPFVRAVNYSMDDWEIYHRHTSENTMVIPLIESLEGINNARSIFAELKPGIDAVAFGIADFAHDISKDNSKVEWVNNQITEAIEELNILSKEFNIPNIGMPWPECTPENAAALIEKGTKIVMYQGDFLVFNRVCQEIVSGIKNTLESKARYL